MSHHHGAAAAHRTIAGLYGLVAVLFGLFLLFGSDDPSRTFLLLVIPAVMLLPVALHLAIAYGAERCKPWARIASIVLGVLMLPGFPIGTALGIWLLINAVPAWVAERRYSGSLADGWPQPPAQVDPSPRQTSGHVEAHTPEAETAA